MKPNILFITADDMNWDAVGAFGCPTPGTTPNIDALAKQGIRFHYGHVTIAVCQPSRSALMTGRYPHHSGGEGFYHLRHEGIPILPEILRMGGYQVGILGKVGHSTPYGEFDWDLVKDLPELGFGRNPEIYYQYARDFINAAVDDGKPFFLMANSHDPHRPFYGNDKADWYEADEQGNHAMVPSKVFQPDEVVTPGFLPDLPDVRLEISEYYSSVRRCDDTVGRLLKALDESGAADNTIVIFLSDNGMAFPYAKTNCYLNSTRTPWIMRWPDQIKPNSYDQTHFVSGIDLMPTLLDAADLEAPSGMDGRSFLPLLRGEEQDGRDCVVTHFHQTAAKRNYPMRCIQNRDYGYIFNPWSNGTRVFRNESQAGRTMAAMQQAADGSQEIADRVELFLHRVPEELYDFGNDPDALVNLINQPGHQDVLDQLRNRLELCMADSGDPLLEAFRKRESRADLDTYLEVMVEEIGGTCKDD